MMPYLTESSRQPVFEWENKYMTDQLRELLRKLNRRNVVSWVPEMKLGKPAYLHLMQALRGGQVTDNQVRNALHALFRLRGYGDEVELLRLYINFVADNRIKVRSEAVKLTIGLVKMHKAMKRRGEILLLSDFESLRVALQRGIEKPVEELTKNFLGQASEGFVP